MLHANARPPDRSGRAEEAVFASSPSIEPPAPSVPSPFQLQPRAGVNPILVAVIAFCVAVALCGAIAAVVFSR
jgi:hypothetical protein